MLPTISAESDTGAHFKQFARVLDSSGARDALASVLGLSDYRFIGIFRPKDGKANAAIHCDRETPAQLHATEVQVFDPEGQLLGTLCHYDVVPRDASQLDLELLVQVAATLQQGDHVPPYPQFA